jgi:nucleotide-binding universal stress UspA family protein
MEMLNSSALVIVGAGQDTTAFRKIADVARDCAMHLSVLVTGILPSVPVHSYPVSPYGTFEIPQAWHELVEDQAKAASATADTLREVLAEESVETDIRVLCAEQTGLQASLSRRALSADIVVLEHGLRQDEPLFRSVLQAAVFNAATGVIVSGADASKSLRARRVFVAWNYGSEAARAVRAALPILRDAEEVTLAIFDPVMTEYGDGENPGSDVARWLTHHGCRVTVQQFPTGGIEVAEAIKLRATEASSDLVVMGAYQHSRMRQIIFGGTTRTMIEQIEFPLLLAH